MKKRDQCTTFEASDFKQNISWLLTTKVNPWQKNLTWSVTLGWWCPPIFGWIGVKTLMIPPTFASLDRNPYISNYCVIQLFSYLHLQIGQLSSVEQLGRRVDKHKSQPTNAMMELISTFPTCIYMMHFTTFYWNFDFGKQFIVIRKLWFIRDSGTSK
jgi:hypothetical protein